MYTKLILERKYKFHIKMIWSQLYLFFIRTTYYESSTKIFLQPQYHIDE